ncbi:MAG: cysteine hydrolase [Chlorobi bacterium]|nr:cysteine hydrolase [Chlorobiota bacterium]
MEINKGETAIVLVEFQKQWTEKGLFNRLIRKQLETRDVVERTRRLVKEARERGVTIIHAPLVVDTNRKKGWLAYLTFGKIFTKDTWKAELVQGLFAEGDIIARREYYNLSGFDAFYKSGLEDELKTHGIKHVFICGFATDQCPSKTLRTALRKGFEAWLVADCTATFNGFFQKNAERKHRERVVNSREFLERLGAGRSE